MNAGESGQAILQKIQAEVNEYLVELFEDYSPSKIKQGKIVRDPVGGVIWLHPHEVAILDTPLMQRLRYVHQTALAYLVYPGAHHTRFEHSIGVADLAGRMASALELRGSNQRVNQTSVLEIRLAGLLHDTGHGLFSHLSEVVMSERFASDLKIIGDSGIFKKGQIGLGELLSYLMVKSPIFHEFWDAIRRDYQAAAEISLDKVASLIVGEADGPRQYQADIISSSFDADKLDYLARDAYHTGVNIQLDLDRILHMISIQAKQGSADSLVMMRGGAHHLEQVLLDKLMLYSAIYHHHKIRSLECSVKAIFEAIREQSSDVSPELRFDRITSHLRVAEYDFFSRARSDKVLGPLVRRLLQRNTLKRAVVMNSMTVVDETQLGALINLGEEANSNTVEGLRAEIFNAMSPEYVTRRYDLWLDFPRNPNLEKEAALCLVKLDESGEAMPLSKFFPYKQVVSSYARYKWTGHIFYDGAEDRRRHVSHVARAVLAERLGVTLDQAAEDHSIK